MGMNDTMIKKPRRMLPKRERERERERDGSEGVKGEEKTKLIKNKNTTEDREGGTRQLNHLLGLHHAANCDTKNKVCTSRTSRVTWANVDYSSEKVALKTM